MGDATPSTEDAIPVRMLSEYAYCPRLFHLMHVEGLWADNRYTAEGRFVHRRVDRIDHVLPSSNGDTEEHASDEDHDPPEIARSVRLESAGLGLVGKLDLVSVAGDEAVPVETKRGRPPDTPERCWEPERVQLMAQGLLLREHGYHCDHGVLYFAASRQRVDVPFTETLETRTRELLDGARRRTTCEELPPPLVDSPKCAGCSLNGICLPDETHALAEVPADPSHPTRRLYPSRDDATPLYIQEPGARLRKKARHLVVECKGETLATAKLKDVSQVVLCGGVQITAATIHLLMEADIPIVHLSSGHWFHGITSGFGLRNAFARAAQFRAADDPARCLVLARAFVAAKVANQRTLLRRNAQPLPRSALDSMKDLEPSIASAESVASLLGYEGTAARHYFSAFATMLRSPSGSFPTEMDGRNARPPRDPGNAMLSFTYAMLAKECSVALASVGLDPHWGFFHRPRHGRPALALDLMEEFRPLIADSAVLTAVNTGMIAGRHFTQAANGCFLTPTGRKTLIRAYEARLDQLVTHPVFDYRCSWRRVIRLQSQLLERHLRDDVPSYAGITTR